ncbi:MAG: response regulator transcription factor [Cyanobacteria bacterium SZAS LIN-2]|nr:response regulator transcription factor [Cyanobacteria bacterium SZAS LIN-2]
MAIKILVADDQEMVRHGIANLLRFQDDFQIVGEAAHGEEAVAMARDFAPDVVLMDIRMPVLNGIEATAKILALKRGIKVLILTTFDDDELVVQALSNGANGYLLKDTPSDQIASAVRAVHDGSTLLCSTVAGKVASYLSQAKLPSSKLNLQKLLTNREIEVLRLIGQGKNNKEIASYLNIAEGTVKNHVSHIFAQIGARDRIQAAMIAQEELAP